MTTDGKTLGQINYEATSPGIGYRWEELCHDSKQHWVRGAAAVADVVRGEGNEGVTNVVHAMCEVKVGDTIRTPNGERTVKGFNWTCGRIVDCNGTEHQTGHIELVRPAPAGEEWRKRWGPKTRGGDDVLDVIERGKYDEPYILLVVYRSQAGGSVQVNSVTKEGRTTTAGEREHDLLPLSPPAPAPRFKVGDRVRGGLIGGEVGTVEGEVGDSAGRLKVRIGTSVWYVAPHDLEMVEPAPAPTYRPFTAADWLIGKAIRFKGVENDRGQLIVRHLDGGVNTDEQTLTFEELLKDWELTRDQGKTWCPAGMPEQKGAQKA